MSFLKSEWKVIKDKELKTIEDIRNAEKVIIEGMFGIIDAPITKETSNDDLQIFIDSCEFKNEKIYEIKKIERTPIIDEEGDDIIYQMLEDFIDTYHERYEHIDDNMVNKFIKALDKKFVIRRKGEWKQK